MIDKLFVAPKGTELSDGIAFAQTHGLSYEIPSFLNPAALDRKEVEMSLYNEALGDFTGALSMHGPVFDMNPVSLDPTIQLGSRARYAQAIGVANQLGVKYLVFHSQYTPIYRVANVYEQWMSACTDFWQELAETHLEGTPLVVVIENFMDETPEIVNELIDRIGSPHVRACLDVGHVNLFSKLPPIDWIDILGHNLVYIHAHNNHGKHDEHLAFHRGTLDLEGFFNHLVLSRYKSHVAIEVFDLPGIRESYTFIEPFMKLQEAQSVSRSFLL